MMTTTNPDRAPDTPAGRRNPARSRGMRQFAMGMAGYGVAVILEGIFVEPAALSTPAGVALALVPMGLAIWAMAGWLTAVRTFDELRQKIFTEAGLISLGITAIVTFTYGFLENLAGLPKLSMFFVFPLMALCYSLSLPVVIRRYR